MKCVMHACDARGGRSKINFHTDTEHYEATVALCEPCWKKMKAANPSECQIRFREVPGQFIDFGITGRLATVHEIRLEA